MEYSNNEIYELQKIIDESDPYLVEVMIKLNEEQLLNELQKLHKEMSRANKDNGALIRRYSEIIKTVESIYEMKIINSGDSRGGVIIG